jgi:DNA-binding transcriptional regulator YiaG
MVASCAVVWEACNVLAQQRSLPWTEDPEGHLSYTKPVLRRRGQIQFWLSANLESAPPALLDWEAGQSCLEGLDLRAACMHLVYAAHAMHLERPWEEDILISDRQIETYLNLDKRKDLSRQDRLMLINTIAQHPCRLVCQVRWPRQGKIQGFSLGRDRLWHLVSVHPQVQERAGSHQVEGFTFRVRAGRWAEYFLNRQGCQEKTAFYQYTTLPKFLLETVMSIWQQHEGAARMLLWLFFKTKLGRSQPILVSTLLRIAYGQDRLDRAFTNREERKRRIRTFESDLEILHNAGFRPIFDPQTYPVAIQPLWARLQDLPEDSEAALDFWINDGGKPRRLTDPAPRGKWQMLYNARIAGFELPVEIEQRLDAFAEQKQKRTRKRKAPDRDDLTGPDVSAGRKRKGLNQRRLAELLGKSQSWVRDIEKGRLHARPADQKRLRQVLDLEHD